MGNMTVMAIQNDAFEAFANNPTQFFEGIQGAMEPYDDKCIHDVAVGNYANYLQVHRSQHNSIPVLCLAQYSLCDIGAVEDVPTHDSGMVWYSQQLQTAKRIILRAEMEFREKIIDTLCRQLVQEKVWGKFTSEEELSTKLNDNKLFTDISISTDAKKRVVRSIWNRMNSKID